MKYEKITVQKKEYIRLEIDKINQKEHSFFIGKMLASDLVKIFTVRPAKYDVNKYSNLAQTFKSDSEYFNSLIRRNEELLEKDFQRDPDSNRINQIKNFINTEEYAFFPNTIILTCDLINSQEEYSLTEDSSLEEFSSMIHEENNLSFLYKESNSYFLLVPYQKNSLLIIDGQHRIEGLKKSEKEIIENYEVLLSIIISSDRSVIAKQFYTINYEQKSVNKSILYQLMGEFSDDLDELTLMHNFTRMLNELQKSAFYKRIKMLGKVPKETDQNEKSLYSISQAFLIDLLLRTISKNSLSITYQPIFLYYYKNPEKQIEIIRFLIKYFNAIKELRSDWEDPSNSVLSKGLGVGALFRVIHFMLPILFIDKWNKDPDRISDESTETIKSYLKGIDNLDMKQFSGQGGAGSINKIKEAMIENILFFKTNTYSDFEALFKKNYLPVYKKWNGKNK